MEGEREFSNFFFFFFTRTLSERDYVDNFIGDEIERLASFDGNR